MSGRKTGGYSTPSVANPARDAMSSTSYAFYAYGSGMGHAFSLIGISDRAGM